MLGWHLHKLYKKIFSEERTFFVLRKNTVPVDMRARTMNDKTLNDKPNTNLNSLRVRELVVENNERMSIIKLVVNKKL